MAKLTASANWIKLLLVAALFFGAVAGHLVLVSRYPVFPAAVAKDPLLSGIDYLKPDVKVESVNPEEVRLPEDFMKSERLIPLINKYGEFDPIQGKVSVKEDLGRWAMTIVLLDVLLLLTAVVAGLMFGYAGTGVAALGGAAVAWGTLTYVHVPALLLQVKLWMLTAIMTHRVDDHEQLVREIGTYYTGFLAQLHGTVIAEAVLIVVAGGLFAFLYDRLTNKMVLDYENKSSEMMSLQAQMFKFQNAQEELTKLDKKFYKLANRLASLQTFTQEVGKSLNLQEVCKKALKVSSQILGAEKCALYLFNDNSGELEAVEALGWADDNEKKEKSKVSKEDPGLIMRAIQSERIQSVSASDDNSSQVKAAFSMSSSKAIPSVMCAPLIVGEKKIGVLNIERMETAPEQDEIRLFYYISTLTGMAVENSKLFTKTENLANFDGLTQLYTNRYMQEFLDRKLEESKRYKHPLSVVMTDIDHFKDFNTIHGHLIGDFVLRETAKLLKSAVRNVDIAARYGGEEFLAVLPETDYKGAYAFAERLRRTIEAKKYTTDDGKVLSVTISIGVSQFPLHHTEKEQLIKKADGALYMAKDGGRNQVKVAPISKEALKKYQETQKE